MTASRTPELTPHTAIGVSLALLGVVLTLDNLGFVDAREVLRFWPLVPMLVGVAYVVQGDEMRDWVVGSGWLGVGTAFLLRNLGVFHFRLSDFLPLLLVAVGLKFILGRSRRHGKPGAGVPPGPFPPVVPPVPPIPSGVGEAAFPPRFDPASGHTGPAGAGLGAVATTRVFALFWGADRRVRGPFSTAEVSAVMGGCDLDLRDAVPTSSPTIIEVFAMWGGIEIRVPRDWLVDNEAWPILGGVVDNTMAPPVPAHRVILRGMAFMGGIEIRN